MSALVRRLGYGGTLCLAVIVSFALLALFAPWLSPYPDQGMGTPNVIAKLKPPSADFWLGTDHLGRDVLSRVIFGARVSMSAGLLIVAFSKAPASVVSPFLYTGVAFSTVMGWWLFDHIPDALAFTGMGLVVLCGVVAGRIKGAAKA